MSDILSHSPDQEHELIDLAMLSNFVHQIVNPLNGVAGTLDNLLKGEIETHRRQQRLGAARAQIEQCITLLRNLAFLSKGFDQLDSAEEESIIIPEIIIEAAMFYQEDGVSKGIRISLKDRETQNTVMGHPELIRQVLMNIFDNCIKYGMKDHEVTVEQWAQKETNNAIIRIVSRSRLPLRLDEIEKFTNLAFRGANARKIVASGTGLGLYICKHIIKSVHKGELRIQAKKPNDLEFMIKLPNGSAGAKRK